VSDPHLSPEDTTYDVAHDVDNPLTVFIVYLVVLGLSLTSIGLSLIGLGKLSLPFQMAVSTIQASVVAYFWMHLKRNDMVVTLCALSGLFWTGILFVLFMADFVTRWRGGL
jgi:cytochrome c oxidase subunit 4